MKPTKEIETAIKKLLDSDVTGYKIYMDTGIDRARISRLRNQEYDIENVTWHVIKKLYDYANKINKKEMIKMANLNFIKDIFKNDEMIFNLLFKNESELENQIENYKSDGNFELAEKYQQVKDNYNTPLIIKDSDVSDLFEVLEINFNTTNDDIVEFCANGSRKDYPKIKLSELDNYKEIDDLDDLYDMQVEDEYRTIYIDNVDNAVWLQDLANAYKYLNEKEIDWNDYTINDYDDVIKLAEDL